MKRIENLRGVFFGMDFPPSSGARSSAPGILGRDRYKGKPDWDRGSNVARDALDGKGAGSSPERGWAVYNCLLQNKQ